MNTAENRVLDALQLVYPTPLFADEIVKQTGMNKNTVRGVLGRLAREKKVDKPAPGAYRWRRPSAQQLEAEKRSGLAGS
jgi:DNA-binding IclR family transcriptional regulator